MGFLDFLNSIASGVNNVATGQNRVGGFASDLAQRLAQQAVATGQGHFSASQDPNAPVGPSMIPGLQGLGTGVNVGDLNPLRNVPLLGGVTQGLMRAETLPLQLTGLGQEAFGSAGKDAAGLIGLAAALAQTHLGDPNSAATVNARMALDQGLAHPGRAITAMREGPDTPTSLLAGGLELATNPLNYVGGIGESGAALNTADNPAALQALGAALQGTARAGQLTNAPAEAAFGLLGKGLTNAPDLPGIRSIGGGGSAFRFGFDPAPAAPTAAQVGEKFVADQAAAQQAAINATPPLTQTFAQNVGYGSALPGTTTLGADQARGIMGDWVGRATDPLATGTMLGQGPSQVARPNAQRELALALLQQPEKPPVALPKPVQPLGDLVNAGRKTAQPTLLEQLQGAAQQSAAREVAPRRTLADIEAAIPKLPETPEAGPLPLPESGPAPDVAAPTAAAPLDFTDRAGTIKAVANAPLDHLNLVLRDLHNAIYPGQSADFAIPALTGQPRAAFRTSFLTDHPSGNAAEPYLDYLLNRVQKDPKAAARLAEINPMLADDVSMVAQSPLAPTEHKRLVQALFDVGPQTPDQAAPSLSGQPGAQTGTLDDLRSLIVGGDNGNMGGYAPNDPAFYAKRLGILPADVPGMLDQLVQEGTLGKLPDGSLGIKPAATAATDRAAWQAKYVGQSQAGTDILAQGDKVGASDLTQADLNALSPQERMAALRKLAAEPAPVAPEAAPGIAQAAPPSTALRARYEEAQQYLKAAQDSGDPASIQRWKNAVKNAAADYNQARITEIGRDAYMVESAAEAGQGFRRAMMDQGPLGEAFGVGKKPALGGDLAAGGGGFGLVPMSTGRVVGGLGGTLVGGGLGFAAPAPDTETRMKRAATGALLGGTLGTGLGSTPQGEALAEEALAGNRAAWQSGSKQIMPTGVSNAVSSLRATQKTALMTIPRNIMDNTIKQALGGKSPVKYLGDLLAQSREWGATLPALRNAGDEQQRMHIMLTSLGPDFANRDPESMARLAVKQGMDYNLDPEDLGTAGAYPPVSAARGAVGALAQPTKLLATGFLTPAVGAAEGLTLAGRAALQNAALTPADMIGRFAFSMPDYTRQLADAAPAFIKKVAASGQSTALLDQEGRFGASLIKDPTLRAEWEAIQHAAEDAGASVALDHMGDFGTHGAFRKITNNAAPGGVWNIGQSQLLARRAAEHPALATGAIRAAFDNYQRALAAGHPDEAGTATIDQDTPGLGLLARLTNGGAAGPLHIPLTYSGSPIGPEVFDVPRQLDPYLHPNQQLYDKIKTITGAAGLGTNPVLDMAAYRLGISDTPHAGASRWAPLGTYAEQAAHAAGIPLLGALAENPVADLLNPAAKPGDVQQQLRTNRYLDPAAITAGNEMIYEMRGTSSSDPQNVDLVAQLRDPNSDFYQAALARGLGARAGSALAGEVIPGHPQAQTATAYAAEAAKTALLNQGLPLTRAQVQEIAARPDGGVVLSRLRQAQIDAAKLQNPLLALQDVSSPQDLGQKVFAQWQRENGGFAVSPLFYNQLAAQEAERLGVVPLGTAMAQQQAYDQQAAGQAYGIPGLGPGVARPPFDPTPLYDLMRYLNGGR